MNFSLGRMKKNPTHILALYNQREKQKTLTIQVLFSTYAILVYIMLCVFLAPADKTRTVLYVCCRDGKKIGHFGVNKTDSKTHTAQHVLLLLKTWSQGKCMSVISLHT